MKELKYKILNFLFVITLGKFFFQWLLPTNPRSHNPICRISSQLMSLDYSATLKSIKQRLKCAVATFIIHLAIALVFFFLEGMRINYGNVIANLYPMWVQVYIGLRCYWAIKEREKNSVKVSTIISHKTLILREVA